LVLKNRNILFLLTLITIITFTNIYSCKSSKTIVEVNNQIKDFKYKGLTFTEAIQFKAPNFDEGVKLEMQYLDSIYGVRGIDYIFMGQYLKFKDSVPYNVLVIHKNESKIRVHFDIRNYYEAY